MCSFAFIPATMTILLSIVSAQTKLFSRLTIIRLNILTLFGIQILNFIPFIINGILDNVPFFNFKMVMLHGYSLALYAHYLVVIASLALIVDNFAPPIAPNIPENYEDIIIRYENDWTDALGVNQYVDYIGPSLADIFKKQEPFAYK